MTDQQIADWIVATCLAFGASVSTAYMVAGKFIEGINLPAKCTKPESD